MKGYRRRCASTLLGPPQGMIEFNTTPTLTILGLCTTNKIKSSDARYPVQVPALARAALKLKVDDFLRGAGQLSRGNPPQVNRERKAMLVQSLGDMLHSLEKLEALTQKP